MVDYAKRLQEMASRQTAATEWEPRLFDMSDRRDSRALADLIDNPQGISVCDTVRAQLIGLIEVREPSKKYRPEEYAIAIATLTGGVPLETYGRWVYYAWSRRLVHVLPEAEFRELRTSSNRNKITAEEQQVLRKGKLGIVGLSTGAAAAITLLLEEIGSHFVLADFDHLDLSNTNRLRVGVSDLGVKKVYVTAREMFEINPYCHIEIFPEGVTEENVDAFLHGTRFGKLDIVFDQCDDLQVKFLLRERAREHRICVVMQTSDRGMMDVERFDLEPGRPILHGLVGNIRTDTLKGLSTYEKVPTALKIVDPRAMSERLAASMIDIETSLKSWPQLASDVMLGAAENADVARRILLGQMTGSGRFFVDLGDLIGDGKATPVVADDGPSYEVKVALEAQRSDLPAITQVGTAIGERDVRALVAYAASAPSGGNCQPWKFSYAPGRLRCVLDPRRTETFLDYCHHASYLAFGCVAENAELVASAMGLRASVRFAPEPTNAEVVCDILLDRSTASPPTTDSLVHHVGQRVTNRKLGTRVPLTAEVREALVSAAGSRGGRLTLLDTPDTLDRISAILERVEMLRMLSSVMHRDMMSEVRWTPEEALATRDGLDVATLELTPTDMAGLRLISSWPLMRAIGALGGGRGLARPVRKAITASAGVGLVTMPAADPRSFFEGGRALQRVWLTANSLGWALQPMTAITYLYDRLAGGGEGLERSQRAELENLWEPYSRLFELPAGHGQMMLFRLHKAGPPTAKSLRRNLGDIVQFEK
jgi:molybdopterin/thiamine biosynthesis adenylyltransferase